MNGATIQNTPAATASSFHPRQFRTYNGEISLVFCTITSEGSAAPTVTPPSSSFFFLLSSKLTLVLFPSRGERTNESRKGLGANLEYRESNRFPTVCFSREGLRKVLRQFQRLRIYTRRIVGKVGFVSSVKMYV